jgi:hypothetical protein
MDLRHLLIVGARGSMLAACELPSMAGQSSVRSSHVAVSVFAGGLMS